MMRHFLPILAAGAALLASVPLPAQGRAAQSPIWTGRSGGYTVAWTTGDLRASGPGGRAVWSAVRPVRADAAGRPGCESSAELALVSVVGAVVSYEEQVSWYCPGTPHPSAYTRYVAVDLARPARTLRLTDLFPEREVLAALLADPVVRKALAGAGARTPPRTLGGLVRALSETSGECAYSFSDDLLTRFAFHHLEGGKVAVRIGLSHGCEVMRGRLTELGILLPVPAPLRAPLAAAAAGREGFLAARRDAVSRGRRTVLELPGR